MKNSIVSKLVLFSLISTFTLVSCEKEDNHALHTPTQLNVKKSNHLNKSNQIDSLVFELEFVDEAISNEYTHHYKNIYNAMPVWTRKVNGNVDFIRNIELVNTPTIEVTNKIDNTITLDLDGSTLTLNSVIGSQDYLSFSATAPSSSRQINFSAEVINEDFTNTLDSIEVGDTLDPNSDFAWLPFIAGAAFIVNSAIDLYCDNKIANEARDCASQGCGVQVESCGAACIDVCTD